MDDVSQVTPDLVPLLAADATYLIGTAELSMNATGYRMYEVYKCRKQKRIIIKEIPEWDHPFHPHFGHTLPHYDEVADQALWVKINSAKSYSPTTKRPSPARKYGNKTGGPTHRGSTFAAYSPQARKPEVRNWEERQKNAGKKQISQVEVKRLLADALGMEVTE
tara:strand:+ start:279 stop:770 length:492 start_codon:yes stop_codon:yes gene_type:complete